MICQVGQGRDWPNAIKDYAMLPELRFPWSSYVQLLSPTVSGQKPFRKFLEGPEILSNPEVISSGERSKSYPIHRFDFAQQSWPN